MSLPPNYVSDYFSAIIFWLVVLGSKSCAGEDAKRAVL
jgi:hypothetical protein